MNDEAATTILPPPVRFDVRDGIGIIRIDEPGKAVNILSAEVMRLVEGILERLEAGEVRAAVLLSGKPGVWIAGADIDQFRDFETAADGERASREGHALLDRLEALPIPVVAAIDGVALGGGLETALACSYRIATDHPATRLGLPEVQLGLLPGAGGTQRLPRLIGLQAALDLMLTGRRVDPGRARRMGLVDEVVPAADLERIALEVARQLAEGERSPRLAARRGSPLPLERVPGAARLILSRARAGVMKKTRGLYPAPLKILEVVGRGLDLPIDRALALEPPAFGELSVSPAARSLVHLFFATTAAKADAAVDAAPRPVERMAVVGAGFMGRGIAVVSAEKGIRVRMKDVSPEAAAGALGAVRGTLTERAERRRRPDHEVRALLDRVEATHAYRGFGTVQLVVEAVLEEVGLKHQVIRELEGSLPEEAVLASNTSTIPISRLAEVSRRPERMIGLHFFSPVEKMPLLEIVVTDRTAPEVTATCHAYAKRIGKTPIVVRDGPGFYTSRILAPFMNEAALLVEEGVPIEEVDDALLSWGFPVGPMTLYDEVGLDVAIKVSGVLRAAFGDRLHATSLVETLVADGRLGRKNGRGLNLYRKGKRVGPDASVYDLLEVTPAPGRTPAAEIQERVVLMMVNEAIRCLEEGILRTPRDGDLGAVLGLGFAPLRGGPFWYADRSGPEGLLARLQALRARHGDRFTPARLLREVAEAGGSFHEGRGGAG